MWIRSKKQLYIWFMLLSLLSLSLSYPSHALSLPPPLHLSLPFSLAQSLASHYLAISPPPFQLFSSSVSLSLFPSFPLSLPLFVPPHLPIPNSSLLPRTPSPLFLPLPPFPPSLHSPRFPPPPFLPPPLPLSPPSCIARTPDLPLNLSFVKHSLYHILLPFLLHHLSSSISIEE